jgi:8-oxo-dGTP diphosphatase
MELHDTTAIVIEKDEELLLIRRRNPPEKGFWAVPGGHVDPGESPIECAEREAREEVGSVSIGEKVMDFVHDVDIGHRHHCYVFLGDAAGEIRAGSDAAEVRWFTLEELKEKEITHYTKKILNKLYEDRL